MSGQASLAAGAVRGGAGLFRLRRGVIRVTGGDRVRWLDGMLTNDVSSLAPGVERSGCYAAALTRQGRIVADLHVLMGDDRIYLDTAPDALAPLLAHLEKFLIADDVQLADASAEFARLGVEGPAAFACAAAACGEAVVLAPDAWREVAIAGAPVALAAFGWSGEAALQVFAPAGEGEAVAKALSGAGQQHGLVCAGEEALEILRIEAGIPRYGRELDEEVLPAEARLERAVSTTKGCYTGQEVVARMASRGRVSHLLVGLRFPEGSPAEPGSEIRLGNEELGNAEPSGARVGEVTSACLSPTAGAIGLGFVRQGHAEPGLELTAGDRRAQVAALPLVEPGAALS